MTAEEWVKKAAMDIVDLPRQPSKGERKQLIHVKHVRKTLGGPPFMDVTEAHYIPDEEAIYELVERIEAAAERIENALKAGDSHKPGEGV